MCYRQLVLSEVLKNRNGSSAKPQLVTSDQFVRKGLGMNVNCQTKGKDNTKNWKRSQQAPAILRHLPRVLTIRLVSEMTIFPFGFLIGRAGGIVGFSKRRMGE